MPRLAVNPPIKPLQLFAKRWLFAAAVVFAAYNPSGHSYWHWALADGGALSLKVVAGIALLALVAATLRMAFVSIGYAGIATVLSLIMGSLLFQDGLGWLAFEDVRITQVTILLWISTVLAVGLSWSFYQRRISGERDVLRNPP
jgi:hypothetical protein